MERLVVFRHLPLLLTWAAARLAMPREASLTLFSMPTFPSLQARFRGAGGAFLARLVDDCGCQTPFGKIERRTLALGHHQGGRDARSGGPDTTDFDGSIALNAQRKASVHTPSEPFYRAEVMGIGAHP